MPVLGHFRHQPEGKNKHAAILSSPLAGDGSDAECSFFTELVGWVSSCCQKGYLKHVELNLLKMGTNFPCFKHVLYYF